MRTAGRAAIVVLVAAVAAAWRVHRRDDQLVRRTDREREVFRAGQDAERARREAEEATARAWTPSPAPDWITAYAQELRQAAEPEFDPYADIPGAYWPPTGGAPVVGVRLGPGGSVEWVTERDITRDAEPEAPDGPGWLEFGDGYGGASR